MSLPHAVAAARAALAAELAPAQADAERRFGVDPPPIWQPTWSRHPTAMRPRKTVWIIGALAVLAIGASVAWRTPMRPAVPLPTAEKIVADATPVEVPDDAALDAGDVSPPVTRPPPSAFTLTRDGTGWRIDAAGASRVVAAQRLAQLGAGTLHGDLGLLASSRPLDLRWQGRRLADAWPAVLGGGASYALQCGRARCAIWLIAAGTPATLARDTSDAAVAMPAAAPPLPAPAAARALDSAPVAIPVSPSDSADPRVSSHHD